MFEIQAGDYVWQTYEQVYQKVIKIGAAIRSFGVKPVSEEF
jgi:long-chain acyl-CoA synthetase